MINILLSVKRPWSDLIMRGMVKWVLRKNAPRVVGSGERVTLWLYESGKDGERAIIGKCLLVCYMDLRHQFVEDSLLMLSFIKESYVTENHLKNYIPCYAWGVQDPVRLPDAVPLLAIGLKRPPQSWQYLTTEQAAILERRESE